MGEITATEVPRMKTTQTSGWEVAAGISDSVEEIEIDKEDYAYAYTDIMSSTELMEICMQLYNLGIEIPEEELLELASSLQYNKELISATETKIEDLEEWLKNCVVSDRVYSINDVSDIEINTNGLSEEKIIYVPDPNDNTKYFQMTIRDFVGYVAANGNNGIYNECFTENDDGTLVFDYNKAKTKLNVVDGTADTIDRNMYANISNDFSMYNSKANQLNEYYQLKSYCEDIVSDIVYNYIEKSDNFIKVLGDDNFIRPTPETLNILKELNIDENIIKNIDCVTEEQKRMILYLYKEGGENSARQYINEQNLNDQINQILGAKEANEFLETMPKDENGNLSIDALTTILTAYEGLRDGAQGYIEGLVNTAKFVNGSNGEQSVNSYKQLYILKAVQSSKILTTTYNTSTSIGNMAIPIASSALLGTLGVGTLSTAVISNSLFFSSNLGNSYNQGKLSGLNDDQARLYAILLSSSETTTQMLLGGIPGLSLLYSSNSFITNILSEGIEESVQEVFNTALMSSMTGETIDLSNLTDEALTAGLYGMLVAGILGGAEKSFKILINGEKYEINQTDLETDLQDSDGAITLQQFREMIDYNGSEFGKSAFNLFISSEKNITSATRFDSNDGRAFEFKMNTALEEYYNHYNNIKSYEEIKNTPEFIKIVEDLYLNDVIESKKNQIPAEEAALIAQQTIDSIKEGMNNGIYKENLSEADVLLNIQEKISITDLYSNSYLKDYFNKNILPNCYVNESGKIMFRAGKIQGSEISRSLFGSLSTSNGATGGAFCFPRNVLDKILNNPKIFDQETGECIDTKALYDATGGVNVKPGKEFSIAYVEVPLEEITLPNGANKNAYFGEFQPTGYTSGKNPEILVPAGNATNISIEIDDNGSLITYDDTGTISDSGIYYKYLINDESGKQIDYYFGKIEKDTIVNNKSPELCDKMKVTFESRTAR